MHIYLLADLPLKGSKIVPKYNATNKLELYSYSIKYLCNNTKIETF